MAVDGDRQEDESVREFRGRYVVLAHDHPFLHWDLMLEDDGVLRTWRLAKEPTPDIIIAAETLPDHRLHYLDYEGPVSGDRGTVTRWDRGRHATRESPGKLVVVIEGERSENGTIVLTAATGGSEWKVSLKSSQQDGANLER